MAETEMGRILAVGRCAGGEGPPMQVKRVSEPATETVCLIYCALVVGGGVGVHVRPSN